MTLLRKNMGFLPATASLLALASGCVSRDQIMLCDPNPFHVDCKTSCVAALDPVCQGFHPTRWTPLDPRCNLGHFGQPPTDFLHGLPTGEPTPAPVMSPDMPTSTKSEHTHSVMERELSADMMFPPPDELEDSETLTNDEENRESAKDHPMEIVRERPSLPSSATVAAILQEFPAKLDRDAVPVSRSEIESASKPDVSELPPAEVVATKQPALPAISVQSYQEPLAVGQQRNHEAHAPAEEKPIASLQQQTKAEDAPKASQPALDPPQKPASGRPRLGSSVKLRR